MWRIQHDKKRGNRNAAKHLQCQDQTASSCEGRYAAIALADGSGNNDYAAKGAGKIVEKISKFIVSHFDELYEMDETQIKFNIIINIKKELYRLCEKYQISLKQLQSTVLAAAMDQRTGKYILCHLGDGVIGGKNGEGYVVLSYPENGVNHRYTRTICSEDVMDVMRIQRGQNAELTQICLLSDGWREVQAQPEKMVKESMLFYRENMKNIENIDDISCIILSVL